jgi:hypothetical protein
MKTQGKASASGLSLFTSIYAFNRVSLIQGGQMYITENSPSRPNSAPRNKIAHNLPFVENLFFFLVVAVFKAYPEVVPPGKGDCCKLLFVTPSVSRLPPSDRVACSGRLQFKHSWTTLWVNKWTPLLPLLRSKAYLRVLSDFTVSFGGGSFKRRNGGQAKNSSYFSFNRPCCRGLFSITKIPFDLLEDQDGRRVATSPLTGLVLKMFSDEEDLSIEQRIYMILSERSIPGIPRYFGSFRNSWMNVDALLISYEGLPLKEEEMINLSDW